MMKHLVFVMLVWIVPLFLPFGAAAAEKKVYTLSVVPQVSAVQIYGAWNPFIKKLSQEVGVEIHLRAYSTIPEFEVELLKGAPDIVYMNPYHQVMAYDAQGYIPLVRDKKDLVGILVARKDSGLGSVKDLDGKEISFPAPNAFAASLYMRALLKEKENITIKPLYVNNHTNVYLGVLSKQTAAGGGVRKTFGEMQDNLKDQLAVVYETPGSASHPLSIHPRVPAEVREKIVKALLRLASDKANEELFKEIQMPAPVQANYDKDYLPLKKLGLGKYVVLSK
ncbi:MAG TPA: phosphate/phosphite/phosphonate ABC transporter substrate-binding protein [Syntrophales bacterium]|nr:phosphate/phosphite/phosphonate ABC transporter substrate-binding protein [Geobacteraceae bacterium]HLE19200.1 phosphate/phosphite/phosphonate ABC transporter substrate-binding protein [Syntrophales bacterium]HLE40690.1 phosphate/phosphite/phosphonate ABC transporter substrate-binding protein [Nitrospirota bacterium]